VARKAVCGWVQATMECGDEFWPLSALIMCLLAARPPWAVSFPDELHLTLRKEIKKIIIIIIKDIHSHRPIIDLEKGMVYCIIFIKIKLSPYCLFYFLIF
jgi:hypothetical protein